MLDWIFEGIVTWVSSIASELMDAVSRVFLDALGTDMDAMEGYFPFVTKAFEVMQYMAWAVLFLITVWQLFRVFGGPITEAENPWQLLLRSALFALLVGAARPIFTIVLDIARAPYTALMEVSMEAEDFTFAGMEEALKNGLTTIVSTVSVVGPILILILLIALGWNYFKLLLECVERYIVVGVLCYTSPLAFAMGGSKATNQVFKSWCRMVGSQLLLLVLNVWFLRAFDSSVGQFIGNGGALASGGGSVFLWLFCALAFLKTAQKFDSYLAAMGLNVAQTGSSMAMEMVMAARVLSGLGGGAKSAGSVFRSGGTAASSAATGAGRLPALSRQDLPASSKATPMSGTRWWRAVTAWAWAAAWALWAVLLGASPPGMGRYSPGSPSPRWPAARRLCPAPLPGTSPTGACKTICPSSPITPWREPRSLEGIFTQWPHARQWSLARKVHLRKEPPGINPKALPKWTITAPANMKRRRAPTPW